MHDSYKNTLSHHKRLIWSVFCGLDQVNAAMEEPVTWPAQKFLVEASTKMYHTRTIPASTVKLLMLLRLLALSYWRTFVRLLGTKTSCGMMLKCDKHLSWRQHGIFALSYRMMGIARSSVVCFVIDTTGSMYDDIVEARKLVYEIIDSKKGTQDEPSEYILVPFNDPSKVYSTKIVQTTHSFTVGFSI